VSALSALPRLGGWGMGMCRSQPHAWLAS